MMMMMDEMMRHRVPSGGNDDDDRPEGPALEGRLSMAPLPGIVDPACLSWFIGGAFDK